MSTNCSTKRAPRAATSRFLKIFIFLFFAYPLSIGSLHGAELVTYGKGTYGKIQAIQWGEGATVSVGKYCSIASGVVALTGGEHRVDWVTTYPFNVLWRDVAGHIKGHPKTKGNIVIGNDVWIAMDAFILSGVKIGDGAVVGAKAVVTKDIPPYAIVGGNPAKIIRYRFDEETIEKLLAIAWWDWPEERIKANMDLLLSNDIEEFIRCNE